MTIADGVTDIDIVNQAAQLIGDNQSVVTGVAPTFDDSSIGVAASLLYYPTVDEVIREQAWDCARSYPTALSLSGNTVTFPWTKEYIYPTNAVQILQLFPASETDTNDPLPYSWNVGIATVSGLPTKVIWTNLANAYGIWTIRPLPKLWDAIFTQAVISRLAAKLAQATQGRPDTARGQLEWSVRQAQVGATRND